jgi:hypothetical protein
MRLDALTPEHLAEWREHPVSVLVRECLRIRLEQQREAMTQAFWAGSPPSEEDRKAYLRKFDLWDDIFDADADRFNAVMEQGE